MPSRGRPRQGDQGRHPQGQWQGLLRRPRGQVGARREPLPGLRRHIRGPVQGHRRPVPVADAVSMGVPQADDLADPRLLHGRRHLSRAAHRLLRRIRRCVLPDAARPKPRRAGRAHHDRAVVDDELASDDGLASAGADAFRAGGPRLGPSQQGGAAGPARADRRGDGPQDRPDPADDVDGGEEQREARLGTDGDAGAPAGEPHPDKHGRSGVGCSGPQDRAHPVRFEAKGFRRQGRERTNCRRRAAPRRSRTPSCWRCSRLHPDTFGPSPWR